MKGIQTTIFADLGMTPSDPRTIKMGSSHVRVILSPEGPLFSLCDLGKVLGYAEKSKSAPAAILKVLRAAGYSDEDAPAFRVRIRIEDALNRASTTALICVGMAGLSAIMSTFDKWRTSAVYEWLAAGGPKAVGYEGILPNPQRGAPFSRSPGKAQASEIHVVYIDKLAVRATRIGGALHLLRRDLRSVLGYSVKSLGGFAMERAFETRGIDWREFTTTGFCTPNNIRGLFYAPAGVRKLVDVMPPKRTVALRAWIDAGGLEDLQQSRATAEQPLPPPSNSADQARPVLSDSDSAELAAKATLSEARTGFDSAAEGEAIHARTVSIAKPTPAPRDARRGYAIELARTIGRYASDHEAAILVEALESVKSTVLRTRHCPGLNDASYDLYSRFFLQTAGGKQ